MTQNRKEQFATWENAENYEMFSSLGLETARFRGPFEGYR